MEQHYRLEDHYDDRLHDIIDQVVDESDDVDWLECLKVAQAFGRGDIWMLFVGVFRVCHVLWQWGVMSEIKGDCRTLDINMSELQSSSPGFQVAFLFT